MYELDFHTREKTRYVALMLGWTRISEKTLFLLFIVQKVGVHAVLVVTFICVERIFTR